IRIAKMPEKTEDVDADYSNIRPTGLQFHGGLPLLKPPYGHLTAIDLNKGEIVWHVPFGDDAAVRANPALKGVTLPAQLGAAGSAGGVVTKGGLIFAGGGGNTFYAIDTQDGKELWKMEMGRRVNSTPMTYRSTDGRQIVVVGSGIGNTARITAFGL